jgi:predicted lipid-binding transport protein (Tim44 family)
MAMVAAFLVFRLRSVLGKRTGHERPPHDPYAGREDARARPEAQDAGDDTVVALPDRSGDRAPKSDIPEDSPAAGGLRDVQAADGNFAAGEFLEGARMAFEMIVTSFAAGDRDTLRPLLSDEVYDNFAGAIEAREGRDETMEMTLVGIREAEILEANMDGRVAFLTVKIVSEQIEVVRDAGGEPVSGDPTKVATVTDIWTFARNTRSRNPNWTLVATEAPN